VALVIAGCLKSHLLDVAACFGVERCVPAGTHDPAGNRSAGCIDLDLVIHLAFLTAADRSKREFKRWLSFRNRRSCDYCQGDDVNHPFGYHCEARFTISPAGMSIIALASGKTGYQVTKDD